MISHVWSNILISFPEPSLLVYVIMHREEEIRRKLSNTILLWVSYLICLLLNFGCALFNTWYVIHDAGSIQRFQIVLCMPVFSCGIFLVFPFPFSSA